MGTASGYITYTDLDNVRFVRQITIGVNQSWDHVFRQEGGDGELKELTLEKGGGMWE